MTAARRADEEVVTFTAASTAVALVARLVGGVDVPRAYVLGDSDPGEVLAAMETVAAGMLIGLQPGDNGAAVLERVGLGITDLAVEAAGLTQVLHLDT